MRSAFWSANLAGDREREDDLRGDIERLRSDARIFFSALQMMRFEGGLGAENRLRVSASMLDRGNVDAGGLVRALEAMEATIALTKEAPEDRPRHRAARQRAA